MKVSLLCFGMLKDHLPEDAAAGRLQLDLPGAPAVRDAVLAAGLPPEKVYAILVDGTQSSLDQRLQDGAEVTLMPQFTGG